MSRQMKAAHALSHAVNYNRVFDAAMPIGENVDVFVGNRFSSAKYQASLRVSPYARWIHYRGRVADRLTRWMLRIPIIGQLVAVFWSAVLDGDGPLPFDALAFSFCNDWFSPTLWHTWYQVRHDNLAPYSGIYLDGAPRSQLHAELKEALYAAEHHGS